MIGNDTSEPLLELREVRKHFPITRSLFSLKNRSVKAVDGVSLAVQPGETLGLVGESGSGKSTVGRIAAGLYQLTDGQIFFDGENVTGLKGRALRAYRTNIQMVFQDPYNSLNPRLTLMEIVSEPLRINRHGNRSQILKKSRELLDAVGLSSNMANRRPQEFSGGQRQRIAVCRALALNPRIIVCDEPVSALDVSIQARIMNLFADLQQDFNLTYLFISHDLNVLRLIADQIAVMYLGLLCETGPADQVFSRPLHPYTQALLESVPDPHDRKGFSVLSGDIPGNIEPPSGCRFHSRCPVSMDICRHRAPPLAEVEKNRFVSCFRYRQCTLDEQT